MTLARTVSGPAPIQVAAILRDTTDGPLWMQAVAFFWFLSTFAMFPGNEFFLYPLTLVLLATLYFERDRIMPILVRCWWLFPIPILAIVSFTWSAYPAATLRYGMFFLLSVLSVIIIGATLTQRQVLRAFFLCGLAGTALAITELGAIIATENSQYLGQKNFYALKMMIGMISAFAVAFNKDEPLPLRLVAMMVIPVDLILVLAASSATSMVLSFAALMMLILSQIFWINSRGIRGLRSFIAGFAIMMASGACLLALSAVNSSVVGEALGAIGKDTTFTGRTALWEQASRTSDEHPVLGVAVGAFWQYDVGAAQTLALNDSKDPGTILGFHSAYWETRVHLGWVGFCFLILSFAIVLWKSAKTFIADATIERTCFFVAALIMFSMSFTESFLFGFFQPAIYIFQMAGVTAIAAAYRTRKVMVNLIPEEVPTGRLRPG